MKHHKIWGAIAMAAIMGTGVANAALTRSACADVNNNGVCDGGDIDITRQISNDGYFSTSRSESGYKAPDAAKVGIVLAGRQLGKNGVLYLVASGDIIVNDAIGSGQDNSAAILVSTGGAIRVATGARLKSGLFLKLSAAGDVVIGDKALVNARNRDLGGQLYVYSTGGSIQVGDKANLSADGYASVATGDATGGDVVVGAGARVWSTKASVGITAGRSISMRSASIRGDAVVIGSHGSAGDRAHGGPGQAELRNCSVEGDSGVRIFADGQGSMVDVTGTTFSTPDPADVTLEADVVVR